MIFQFYWHLVLQTFDGKQKENQQVRLKITEQASRQSELFVAEL